MIRHPVPLTRVFLLLVCCPVFFVSCDYKEAAAFPVEGAPSALYGMSREAEAGRMDLAKPRPLAYRFESPFPVPPSFSLELEYGFSPETLNYPEPEGELVCQIVPQTGPGMSWALPRDTAFLGLETFPQNFRYAVPLDPGPGGVGGGVNVAGFNVIFFPAGEKHISLLYKRTGVWYSALVSREGKFIAEAQIPGLGDAAEVFSIGGIDPFSIYISDGKSDPRLLIYQIEEAGWVMRGSIKIPAVMADRNVPHSRSRRINDLLFMATHAEDTLGLYRMEG
jgi:hypothetical protein